MGTIKYPQNVRLIAAVCYNDVTANELAQSRLTDEFGPVLDVSQPIDFGFTDYYNAEMGSGLQKQYYVFQNLVDPISLPDAKLFSNELEEMQSQNGYRTVNIDPGYIEPAKLVLASTKNFSHRIYIGQGIYGDVQLVWQGGNFRTNPWTYPDYKLSKVLKFFEHTRQYYFNQIKKDATSGH